LEITCQRCHETLGPDDRYCAVCGLPQLVYVAAEAPLVQIENESGSQTSDPVGAQTGEPVGAVSGIAWRPALRAAVLLSIPAGVLCSGITPIGQSLGLVWMLGAAAWAVNLYSKRAHPGWVSMGAGARIGLVTGLFASWLTVTLNGAVVWAGRFLLHQGSEMDSVWLTDVEKSLQLSQQMAAQMGMATAQAAQSTQMSRAWMLSPEGHAGIALATFLAGAAFLILFATLGGAMGARLFAQARRPGA
jgi:RNA polymerase subunit RPABC4/transcription elongation factor Spt4